MSFTLILVFSYTISTALHIVGLWLLYATKGRGMSRNQQIFLCHLSVCEILISVTVIVRELCGYFQKHTLYVYIMIPQWTTLTMVQFLLMICLTMDRFLRFYLNLKYPSICTIKREKLVLFFVWVMSSIAGGLALVCMKANREEVIKYATVYIYPPFEIGFLIVAGIAYGYIFRTILRSKFQRAKTNAAHKFFPDISSTDKDTKTSGTSCKAAMRNLLFPTLVVASFIIFMVIPDQIYFYSYVIGYTISKPVEQFFLLCYAISYVSDAVIYILMLAPIRKQLTVAMKHIRKNSNSNSNSAFTISAGIRNQNNENNKIS